MGVFVVPQRVIVPRKTRIGMVVVLIPGGSPQRFARVVRPRIDVRHKKCFVVVIGIVPTDPHIERVPPKESCQFQEHQLACVLSPASIRKNGIASNPCPMFSDQPESATPLGECCSANEFTVKSCYRNLSPFLSPWWWTSRQGAPVDVPILAPAPRGQASPRQNASIQRNRGGLLY